MSTFGTHPVLSWNFEASTKGTPYKVIVNQGGAAAGNGTGVGSGRLTNLLTSNPHLNEYYRKCRIANLM